MPRLGKQATIPTGYAVARVDAPEGRRYLPLRLVTTADREREDVPLHSLGTLYVAISGPKRSHFDAAATIYRDVARRVDAGELRADA